MKLDLNTIPKTSEWNLSTTEVISTVSSGTSDSPVVCVDRWNNIHVAWKDTEDYLSAGTDSDIFYQYYSSSTHSWSTTEVVTVDSTTNIVRFEMALSHYNNKDEVHIIWEDNTDYSGEGTDQDLFYRKMDFDTKVWSSRQWISQQYGGTIYAIDMCVDLSGIVHAVWQQNNGGAAEIYYLNSTSSWSGTPALVSTDSSTDPSYNPAINHDAADNIHFVWADGAFPTESGAGLDLFYRSLNKSNQWSEIEFLSTTASGDSYVPTIALDSEYNIYVAWQGTDFYLEDDGGDQDIFFVNYTAATDTWSEPVLINTNNEIGSSIDPVIKLDSEVNIYLTWWDEAKLQFRCFNQTEQEWGTQQTFKTSIAYPISMAVLEVGNIALVYSDNENIDGNGVDLDVKYNEITFFEPDIEAPSIDLVSPQNGTYGNMSYEIQFTILDNNGLDQILYSWNHTSNQTLSNQAPFTIPFASTEGMNQLDLFVNDTTGNSISASYVFNTDNTLPTILLDTNLEGMIVSTSKTISINPMDNMGIDHVEVFLGTELIYNNTEDFYFNIDPLQYSPGDYVVKIRVFDIAKNELQTTYNISIARPQEPEESWFELIGKELIIGIIGGTVGLAFWIIKNRLSKREKAKENKPNNSS